ncbi:hypothetical protein GPJ56_008627 [Histomonas meleagridis]|uniref:uncharacterized protein n=1 Tax=Histomonas meleagridis TaxID=135588 RepID=UPI003559B7C4|nr:hypothetical protein GPJ56_008627 [Histomonas meleagridis]KAH0805796.1 hypothetical protein GO595_001435 [Histomonas meleagridis]
MITQVLGILPQTIEEKSYLLTVGLIGFKDTMIYPIIEIGYDFFGLLNWNVSYWDSFKKAIDNITMSNQISLQDLIQSLGIDAAPLSGVYKIVINLLSKTKITWPQIYEFLGAEKCIQNYLDLYEYSYALSTANNDNNMNASIFGNQILHGLLGVVDLLAIALNLISDLWGILKGPFSKIFDFNSSPLEGRMHHLEDFGNRVLNMTERSNLYSFLVTLCGWTTYKEDAEKYIIPLAKELATGHPNLKTLLVDSFGLDETNVTFYLTAIDYCTSTVNDTFDVFQICANFVKNETLIQIAQGCQEVIDAAERYTLSTNLKDIFSLAQYFNATLEGALYYRILCETIKDLSDKTIPIEDYFIVRNLNNTITKENVTMIQNLTNYSINTKMINYSEASFNNIKSFHDVIAGLKDQTLTTYLQNTIHETTEFANLYIINSKAIDMIVHLVGQAIPPIINLLAPIFNSLKLGNTYNILTKGINEIGNIIKSDFKLSDVLNVINDKLGEAFFMMLDPLNEMTKETSLRNVLDALPKEFCDLLTSLEKFCKLDIVSLGNVIDSIVIETRQPQTISVNVNDILPLKLVFDICNAIKSDAENGNVLISQIAEVGNLDLSFIEVIVNDLSKLVRIPCRPLIVKVVSLISKPFGRKVDNVLGRIHTAASDINMGNELNMTFPNNSPYYDYEADY